MATSLGPSRTPDKNTARNTISILDAADTPDTSHPSAVPESMTAPIGTSTHTATRLMSNKPNALHSARQASATGLTSGPKIAWSASSAASDTAVTPEAIPVSLVDGNAENETKGTAPLLNAGAKAAQPAAHKAAPVTTTTGSFAPLSTASRTISRLYTSCMQALTPSQSPVTVAPLRPRVQVINTKVPKPPTDTIGLLSGNTSNKYNAPFWKQYFINNTAIAWTLFALGLVLIIAGGSTYAEGTSLMNSGTINCNTDPSNPACNVTPLPSPSPSPIANITMTPNPSPTSSASNSPLPFADIEIPNSFTMRGGLQQQFINNIIIFIKAIAAKFSFFADGIDPDVYLQASFNKPCLTNIQGDNITQVSTTLVQTISLPYSTSNITLPALLENATAEYLGPTPCILQLSLWCANCLVNMTGLLAQSNTMNILQTMPFASPLANVKDNNVAYSSDYYKGENDMRTGAVIMFFGAIPAIIGFFLIVAHYLNKNANHTRELLAQQKPGPVTAAVQFNPLQAVVNKHVATPVLPSL